MKSYDVELANGQILVVAECGLPSLSGFPNHKVLREHQPKMQIQALNDQILIRLHLDSPNGGLILPDTVEGLNPHGEVLSVGPKVESCKPGDLILMNPNSPMQIDHEGEKLWFVQDHCVIGKYIEN